MVEEKVDADTVTSLKLGSHEFTAVTSDKHLVKLKFHGSEDDLKGLLVGILQADVKLRMNMMAGSYAPEVIQESIDQLSHQAEGFVKDNMDKILNRGNKRIVQTAFHELRMWGSYTGENTYEMKLASNLGRDKENGYSAFFLESMKSAEVVE